MIENHRIAVIVPAYRVSGQIESVISAMPDCVDQVIVVDDASPDDVSLRVERMLHPKVRLIRHARNQGVGGATVSGMKAALEWGADILIKCDGDGQMEPAHIPFLVEPLVNVIADYSKGSRFEHFEALRAMPKRRFLGNICLTFLTKMAAGYWNVLDPVNGFIAVRADVLARLNLDAISPRYFFETDMLIRLNILEARVIDVPLPARYGDEHSTLSISRTLIGFPGRLLAGLIRRVFWRYIFYDVSPVAVFACLGLVLTGFGVTFGGYHWIRNAIHAIPTPVGTVILAALPTIIGFELLLQAAVLDIQNTPRPGGPPPRRVASEPKVSAREKDEAVTRDLRRRAEHAK
jgi:dolichol-phosphate mannosyltransferase